MCFSLLRLEMMSFGDRSQAAAGGPTGIHPAQKVPMGLGSITAYTQSASVPSLPGVSSSHTNTRYSSSSAVAASAIPSAVGYSSLTSNSHNSSFPINPDVKLKKLPFYDILGELLKPSSLGKRTGFFSFIFTKVCVCIMHCKEHMSACALEWLCGFMHISFTIFYPPVYIYLFDLYHCHVFTCHFLNVIVWFLQYFVPSLMIFG